jgi:hypothetical protein
VCVTPRFLPLRFSQAFPSNSPIFGRERQPGIGSTSGQMQSSAP